MVCAGKLIKTLVIILSFLLIANITLFARGAVNVSNDSSILACGVRIYNGGKVLFVSPFGRDRNSGLTSQKPLKHIQRALDLAYPGDTIVLLPGKYYENIHSVRSGAKGKPITIVASPGATIYGYRSPGKRVVDITHSYIHLVNLRINGNYIQGCNALKCYHDKLIYIHGSYKMLIRGIMVLGCRLKNAWGECLRIKYTNGCRIAWNTISHCGIRDFVYKRGKQNGEGVYIGTAPEQSRKRPDTTRNVYVFDNFIATYGAECVDVKENSSNVFVYGNLCTGEKAIHVGGISVRSNGNLVEGNIVFGNLGAGIRLGGDTRNDGIGNFVIGNYMVDNRVAGLKVMALPQGKLCSNVSKHEREYYPDNKTLRKAYEPCDK